MTGEQDRDIMFWLHMHGTLLGAVGLIEQYKLGYPKGERTSDARKAHKRKRGDSKGERPGIEGAGA